MQNYVICDDDQLQSAQMLKLLNKYTTRGKFTEYTSGIDIIDNLEQFCEGTIFIMDIVLKDISGIDVAKKIKQNVKNAVIIFVSGFLEKATEVYEVDHCYFVYKPELQKKLPKAIKKAEEIIHDIKSIIQINQKNKVIVIPIKDICYVERTKRITNIHCVNEIYECTQNFSFFLNKLGTQFCQCHCSYIVNLDTVREFQRTEFHLNSGDIIPISRAYSKEAKQNFQEYIMHFMNQI